MNSNIKYFKAAKVAAIVMTALCLGSINLSAQDLGVSTRSSAEVDWKIRKGLHLNAGYELRTKTSLAGIERHQVSVGIDYKVCDYFKVGGEYFFIGHFDSMDTFKPRHRLSLNLTGQYSVGDWKFSLREKLQLTHNAYEMNKFQNVPNALQLKTRFTVKWQKFRVIEPFAYIEMRNIFNAPKCSATWNESTGTYSDYEFLGYDHAYINRLRGAMGFDCNITRAHSIEFTLMYNRVRKEEIDTNKDGTLLKSLYWKDSHELPICIRYKYSF